jgi:hypothetical protein
LVTRKITSEKQATYKLRKVKRDDVTRVIHGQKQSSSPSKKKIVTKTEHNETQANSPTETRKPQSVSPEE